MSARPSVSVVMPFAGDRNEARAALAVLIGIEVRAGDELILADNSGTAPAADGLIPADHSGSAPAADGIVIVAAGGEHSPAHARNAGAARGRCEWILFLDADCVPRPGLLDAYFAAPIEDDVGALAGEVVPAPGATTVSARYGAACSFLSQRAHLAHPYLPRAVAANLLVRRAAFSALGGFFEGVRAAEDTDFSWRLQQAGWRIELRTGAVAEHRYRASLAELRAQWRGYAAGRAWLRRRYPGFAPEPAVRRATARAVRRVPGRTTGPPRGHRSSDGAAAGVALERRRPLGVLERGQYFALDALLAVDELAGFGLSNRPASRSVSAGRPRVVLVADVFPVPRDPFVEFACAPCAACAARVEAAARPPALTHGAAHGLEITYREDDGFGARALALGRLAMRHPVRCLRDLAHRAPDEPTLSELAPVVARLERASGARLHPLGGTRAQAAAHRLAALAGHVVEPR